jgi:hypothetical protein
MMGLDLSLGFSPSSIGMGDAMENTATMTVNHTSPMPLFIHEEKVNILNLYMK